MSRVYYQVGLPGQPASFCVPDTRAIRTLAEAMPPGRYWVDEVHTYEDWDPVHHWVDRALAHPYGELIVTGPGDWCLQALSGVTEGPGYVIV